MSTQVLEIAHQDDWTRLVARERRDSWFQSLPHGPQTHVTSSEAIGDVSITFYPALGNEEKRFVVVEKRSRLAVITGAE